MMNKSKSDSWNKLSLIVAKDWILKTAAKMKKTTKKMHFRGIFIGKKLTLNWVEKKYLLHIKVARKTQDIRYGI